MRSLRLVLASALLCAVASVGCKQDIGERCEQPSDCASGYCGGSSISEMTSAQGRTCSAGPMTSIPTIDAGATVDAASEPAGEAGATDVGGETPPADAGPDARGDAASDAADAASEVSADVADAEDSAGDLAGEAAAGG